MNKEKIHLLTGAFHLYHSKKSMFPIHFLSSFFYDKILTERDLSNKNINEHITNKSNIYHTVRLFNL